MDDPLRETAGLSAHGCKVRSRFEATALAAMRGQGIPFYPRRDDAALPTRVSPTSKSVVEFCEQRALEKCAPPPAVSFGRCTCRDAYQIQKDSRSLSPSGCWSIGGFAPNGGFCELSNRRTQPRGGRDSSKPGSRPLATRPPEPLADDGWRSIAHDRSTVSESSTAAAKRREPERVDP